MSFLVRQKFRFDLASAFLNVANFAMLLGMNNQKICSTLGISPTAKTAVWVVLCGVFALWLLGFILDMAKMVQHYNREMNSRNEMLQRIERNVA